MAFVACGLNHESAPIEIRETFALSATADSIRLNHFLNEVVILSTCNRTEIYCDTDNPNLLITQLSDVFQCSADELTPYIYLHQDQAAVRHLLRVAIGLDSMMLGEPQILGQLKRAYLDACNAGTVKKSLRHVFQTIFSAAKRVRTQSGVGNNPISIAYAAVQLIIKQFKDLSSLHIFIIGSGETASLVAKYLHQKGVHRFMIANRTLEHAQSLAARLNGQALSITDIPHYLPQADVVISATTCPLPFITQQWIERALITRHHTSMLLLDLAVPRDIEPNVGELDGVNLYNIDDLHTIVGEGMEVRRAAALHAEQLIEFEMEQFIDWERSEKANEVITDYRNQMSLLAEQELTRAQQKLSSGKCQHSVLAEFSERLVNKLTHLPTIGLRQAAFDERADLLNLVQTLLNKTPESSTL